MARAATTTDAFTAVAEPARRQILDLLADGERSVSELVEALDVGQPQVSKHLRVLRLVGAVRAREEGRRRLYRVEAGALRPIRDWVAGFEDMWAERFEAIDTLLDELSEEERGDDTDGN